MAFTLLKPTGIDLSQTFAFTGSVTGAGGGKLLQVVDNATTTVVTHSTSYADTTLNCSITPTATSSKIYILVTQCVFWNQNGLTIQILRDSTSIFAQPVAYTMYDDSVSNARDIYSIQYLDSPSSTSAINYKTQCKLHSAGTIQTQESNQKSRITLMEIAG